jgi:hypothetical protein
VLAHDKDPVVRAAAREIVSDLQQVTRPRPLPETRKPAYWYQVIDLVILQEPRHSKTGSGYKTGHGYAHTSKSGTCLSVDTRLGLWYCSSCRRGGDAVHWVMDIEECSYGQAWQILVDRFGAARASNDPD